MTMTQKQKVEGFGLVWRGIRAFGPFWWDFLIGDSPEIAIGVVLILGIAFAVRTSTMVAAVVVPVAVILLLALSAWRGKSG